MQTFRSFALLAVVAFSAFSPLCPAASYGPISVQEIQLTENRSDRTGHGYVEYRFRIINRDSKAHRVSLAMPQTVYSSGSGSLSRSTNSLEVPPNSTVVMRLLQPPVEIASGSAEVLVAIDGRFQRDGTAFAKNGSHFQRYSHSGGNTVANVFVSNRVPPDIRDLFRTGVSPAAEESENESAENSPMASTPGTPTEEVSPWLANVPVEEWSDNWLAYTRFDAVVLADEDWRLLQDQYAPILQAIRKYVEAGGVLAVIGSDWAVPKEWTLAPNTDRQRQAVFGIAYTMNKTLEDARPQIENFRQLALGRMKTWQTAFGDPGMHYPGMFSSHSTGSASLLSGNTTLLSSMPVVANYGVSVKLIMVLIVAFAILIGPVNIYVLSLLKRRIWLLWTVPVTSLLASVLVLGASFFQEGLLRQSSSITYTVLDQRREEATSFGFVGYYATLTPRGLVFSPDTEATPCVDRGYYGDARSMELDLAAGGNQHFSQGWINARVPCYFAVRKAQSQRKERIAFDWTAEPPTVTNGLGIDIERLNVCSPDGNRYAIDDLKAGGKVSLRETEESAVEVSGNRSRTDAAVSSAMQKLRASHDRIFTSGPGGDLIAPSDLPPGAYLAEIGSWNPFIEPGIDRMKPYQNKTTIYGIFE